MIPINISKFLARNYKFLILIVLITSVAYYNSIFGEFSLVDDYSGFIENESIKSISGGFGTFKIQNIIYSVFYKIFGISSTPLHIFSILMHLAVTFLVFALFYLLFNKEIAQISSLLFAVHPVNTEAVSWISGSLYLYNAIFAYLTLIYYVIYKNSKDNRFLYVSVAIYTASLALTQNVWMLGTPLALVLIDQFILEKEFSKKSLSKLAVFLLPMIVFSVVIFAPKINQRVSIRQDENRVTLNQQNLTPIIESYPFTTYKMAQLYLVPKTLTIFYDGNELSRLNYVLMYVAFLFYILGIAYFYKKSRALFGILLVLPILIAPSYSPYSVSWSIAERYLYIGTGFFTTLLAFGLKELDKKLKVKYFLWIIIVLLVVLYSYRTFLRNKDWKSPRIFSLATIETSPNSPRPHLDLGVTYFVEKDYESALKYFNEALVIRPSYKKALNNIGIVYILNGFSEINVTNEKASKENIDASNDLFKNAAYRYDQKEIPLSVYYSVETLKKNQNHFEARLLLGKVYQEDGNVLLARRELNNAIKIDEESDLPYMVLGFVEFERQNYSEAKKYLQIALVKNPDNKTAKKLIEAIETR